MLKTVEYLSLAATKAIAIVGAVLEFGIEPTMPHAADLGYIPLLIEDACYSFSEENKKRSLSVLRSAGLITDTKTFQKAFVIK